MGIYFFRTKCLRCSKGSRLGHGVPKNRYYLCFSSTNAVVSDLLTPSGDAANYSLTLLGELLAVR